MDAKKASTPRQSARYLLYADRALQKISLRRISVRPKKARKPSASSRTKKPAARAATPSRTAAKRARAQVKTPRPEVKTARPEVNAPRPELETVRAEVKASRPAPPSVPHSTIDRWWIAFGVVCVVGIMVVMGVPSRSRPAAADTKAGPADEMLFKEDVEPQPAVAAKPTPKPTAPRTVTARPAPDSAWVSKPAKPHPTEPAKASVAEPVKTTVAEPAKVTPAPPAVATPATTSAPVANAAITTIQGCLQAADEGFWLKDTSGADAPKARSWKSGFLRKRSASIEVIDPGSSLRLSKYVGQRVAATGTLTDKRLQAHSLHTVAATCD